MPMVPLQRWPVPAPRLRWQTAPGSSLGGPSCLRLWRWTGSPVELLKCVEFLMSPILCWGTIRIKRKSWFWWKLVKICRNMSKHRGCYKSSGQNGLRLLATCGVAIPNWQQYLFQDVPDWWFQSFHFGRWKYGSDWNDQSLSLDM